MMNTNKPLDRRRLSRRHLIYYLRVFDGAGNRVLGHVVEISASGLMLVSEEPLTVQEEYRLRMKIGGLLPQPDELVFQAVCKWCREDVNPDFYLAGFLLQNITPHAREIIEKLVDEFGFSGA